jgi:hypothetical protein
MTFYAKDGKLYITLGIVFLLFMGLLASKSGSVTGLGTGVMVLAMGVWLRISPVVRFEPSHLEVRRAPLAAIRRFRYRDIVDVHHRTRDGATLSISIEGKRSEEQIKLRALSEADQEQIFEELRRRLALARAG